MGYLLIYGVFLVRFQRSIDKASSCSGVGLHTGKFITLSFLPAPVNTGVVFIRRDMSPPVFIKALADNVRATDLSTTLGKGNGVVQTVEHILSAVSGLNIDNLYIEIDGPEIPIMDGSASVFISMLKKSGIVSQGIGQPYLKILKTVELKEGNKRIRIEPSPKLSLHCLIDYDHPFIGKQSFSFNGHEEMFIMDISSARTFCFLEEVKALWKRGVAKGGSLDNAIVIDDTGIINETGLRYQDEFARHKILDLIGDLSLIGMPFVGKVTAERVGHAFHTAFVSKLLSKNKCWKIITPVEREEAFVLPRVDQLTPESIPL